MNLRSAYEKFKTTVNDNRYKIAAAVTTVGGLVAVGVALYYKQELVKESSRHRKCHDFTHWVTANADNGDKLLRRVGEDTYELTPIAFKEE